MKFDDVLRDLAEHLINEATMKYECQREWHEFKPFSFQRETLSAGGSTFRVKIEFEPSSHEAAELAARRN